MRTTDKQAWEFVEAEGLRLRGSSYLELSTGMTGLEDVVPLASPETLNAYRFSRRRTKLKDGSVRIYIDGVRPSLGGLLSSRHFDAFDKLPDDSVREIPMADEDYCGKS